MSWLPMTPFAFFARVCPHSRNRGHVTFYGKNAFADDASIHKHILVRDQETLSCVVEYSSAAFKRHPPLEIEKKPEDIAAPSLQLVAKGPGRPCTQIVNEVISRSVKISYMWKYRPSIVSVLPSRGARKQSRSR
jgi:hypothetical protein